MSDDRGMWDRSRPDDWIEWKGGECPVGRFTSGWARLRCDHPDFQGGTGPYNIGGLRWEHNGGNGDIVAYRLAVETSELPEGNRDAHSALNRQPSGTHYSDAAIQPVQFIEANKLGFLEGCIVKRATRHNHPTGKGREDIEKIIHEAQLLLELRYGGGCVMGGDGEQGWSELEHFKNTRSLSPVTAPGAVTTDNDNPILRFCAVLERNLYSLGSPEVRAAHAEMNAYLADLRSARAAIAAMREPVDALRDLSEALEALLKVLPGHVQIPMIEGILLAEARSLARAVLEGEP